MSKYGNNSDLCKFLIDQSDSYNAIFERVKIFALSNKQTLDFRDEDFHTGYITLEEIHCKFAENVFITDDKVEFDVIVEADFSVKKKYRGEYDDATESLWFRLICNMTITDKLEWFSIKNISEYSKEKRKSNPFPATVNFVPVISKEEFDLEAERFLEKWFPLGLKTPMPIPIETIVNSKMGLTVIKDKSLTKDFKIFGQICFSDGNIKTYNEDDGCYVDTTVKRGMVFIDPNTFFLRNLGCANNTLAHEAFHWERHRIYATIRNLLTKEQAVACRCPTSPKGNVIKDLLSEDEDWMEWQANGIAPKILMPKNMAIQKAKELVDAHGYVLGTSDCYEVLKRIIDEMSDFFKVSKQAAKIRMIEIGYPEALNVYNYEAE